jgi:hypothetical protein
MFAILLLFISGCSLGLFSDDEPIEEVQEEKVSSPKIEKKDFGPVFTVDKENYKEFQARIACGETHERLLDEYNWTIDRVVEVGRKVDDETLKKYVFARLDENCETRLDVVEPSIG